MPIRYFNAVARMSPPVALMLEHLAPTIIVGWMWFRTHRRPGGLTILGAVTAMLSLVIVLDLFSDAHIDALGVLWGLAAAACLAVYFLLSAKVEGQLPPFVMVSGGMVFGATAIVVFALLGLLPMSASYGATQILATETSWIVPVLGLALIATVASYSLGILAAQRLGPKVASFVALTEVLFSVVSSWLLIGNVPAPFQAVGGALIVAGTILVQLDDLRGLPAKQHWTSTEAIKATQQ